MDSKIIPLTKGFVTIVDAADYDWLMQYKWHFHNAGYAGFRKKMGDTVNGKRNRKTILMHRLIMQTPDGMETDHINHNTLDNRRSNLRICSHIQNQHNRIIILGSSKYKGVYWCNRDENWKSKIQINKKEKYLGSFADEVSAAIAYNAAALKYFGEFARLNVFTEHR